MAAFIYGQIPATDEGYQAVIVSLRKVASSLKHPENIIRSLEGSPMVPVIVVNLASNLFYEGHSWDTLLSSDNPDTELKQAAKVYRIAYDNLVKHGMTCSKF